MEICNKIFIFHLFSKYFVKNTLIISILITFSISCSAQGSWPYYFPGMNLMGVKSVQEFSNDSSGPYIYILINENGYVIEETKLDCLGIVRTTNKYNGKGNKIERIDSELDGSIRIKYFYKYDDRKNMIEECQYVKYDNQLIKRTYRSTYIYDAKGNKIEAKKYGVNMSDSTAYDRWTFVYDEHGNMTEETLYDFYDDTLFTYDYKDIYIYDDRGNMTENKRVFFPDTTFAYKEIYIYDDKGNKIEENFIYREGHKSKFTFDYDDKGNKIEAIEWNFDSIVTKDTYKYDDRGNLIEEHRNGMWGDVNCKSTYKYKFDNNGNWIEKTTMFDKCKYDRAYTLRRKIEYYSITNQK